MAEAKGVAASIVCQCASISPGISVFPLPLMSVVSARRSVGIGAVEIFSILFPRTRTFEGPESSPLLPSKMRTFENTVTRSRPSCPQVEEVTMQAIETICTMNAKADGGLSRQLVFTVQLT